MFDIFLHFKFQVENFFERKIQVVQFDWESEYKKFQVGLLHQVSFLHIHKQNGFIERKYKHIVETGFPYLHMPRFP